MKYIFVLMLFVTVAFGQTKEQRYQIIQTDKIEDGHRVDGIAKSSTASEKKTILLLDTFTGRCWILTPITRIIDEKISIESYEWTPLPFSQQIISAKDFLPK